MRARWDREAAARPTLLVANSQNVAARVRAYYGREATVLHCPVELERFWARLVDEYDLPQRGRAIARKLEVIRSTADTITDLMATRTSHRLEVYIIGLIAFEIGLSLYDHFWK